MSKQKIGIFGGSFNPVHNGHIALAKELLSATDLDEIWFMVSPHNPLKPVGSLLDDSMRLRLVVNALENEDRLKACDYEFHLPKPSYMLNTLQHLSADYPDTEFTLLIGADNWECFPKWHAYEDIIRNYSIIIYPREGSEIDASTLPSSVTLVPTPLYTISSTKIRENIATGISIEGLVPECIRRQVEIFYASLQV